MTIVILQQPAPTTQLYIDRFKDNTYPAAQIEALAGLFELQSGLYDSDDQEGLSLFYNLSLGEQLALFSQENARARSQETVTAIRRISLTLDAQDPNDLAIMGEMITALGAAGQSETDKLIEEIRNWKVGRELAEKGQYQDAIEAYSKVILSDNDNPTVRYDRSLAYLALGHYPEATADLEQVVRIAGITPSAHITLSRFAGSEQMKELVREIVRGDDNLLDYLQKNQGEYPQLVRETISIIRAAEATKAALIAVRATSTAMSTMATETEIALQQAAIIAIPTPTITMIPPTPTLTATAPTPTPTPSPRPTLTPSPIVPTRPPPPPVDEGQERQLIILINQRRGENGCSNALKYSGPLTAAARRHSIDMATNHFFDLRGSDGTNVTTWAREAGYTGGHVRVNIAASGPPDEMVEVWMQDDITRRQMLDCTYNDLGVGYAQGDGTQYASYWTVIFGAGVR